MSLEMKEYWYRNINSLRKSSFIRSISILISGQAVSQFITLITIPIISRIYSEQAYGEFAIYLSTAQIILGIGPLGLRSAIMAPKELQRAKDVFFAAFMLETVIFTFFFIIALAISPFFHFYSISVPYKIAILLCFLYMSLSGYSQLLSVYVNRLSYNRLLFWNSIIGAFSTLFISIPLGYFGYGVLGLILAGIIGPLAASIQMMMKVNPIYKILNIKEIISVCSEFKEYILYQFPSNCITTLAIQLPNQAFSASYGNTALGGYAMSERVLGYPIRLIASPVGTVYFRHASKYMQEGKLEELGKFTYSFITKILYISFLPLLFFMIFSKHLFAFALGSKWESAGLIASILAIQYVFKFCEQCISYCLVVLNKQKINFLASIIYMAVIGISLGLGMIFFKTIIGAIYCFTIGSTIMQIILLNLDFYYLKIPIPKFILFLITYALIAAGITICVNIFI
jgi:O-antigen/teichoic acid export membrane protein